MCSIIYPGSLRLSAPRGPPLLSTELPHTPFPDCTVYKIKQVIAKSCQLFKVHEIRALYPVTAILCFDPCLIFLTTLGILPIHVPCFSFILGLCIKMLPNKPTGHGSSNLY